MTGRGGCMMTKMATLRNYCKVIKGTDGNGFFLGPPSSMALIDQNGLIIDVYPLIIIIRTGLLAGSMVLSNDDEPKMFTVMKRGIGRTPLVIRLSFHFIFFFWGGGVAKSILDDHPQSFAIYGHL